MKKRIVIKVQMSCEKCRSKAMTIATKAKGVTSVAIEGTEKDQVVVIGDGVDSVCLTIQMRKKVCRYASLVSVEDVKPPKKDVKPPVKLPEKVKEKDPSIPSYVQYQQCPVCVVYDPMPTNNCTIM